MRLQAGACCAEALQQGWPVCAAAAPSSKCGCTDTFRASILTGWAHLMGFRRPSFHRRRHSRLQAGGWLAVPMCLPHNLVNTPLTLLLLTGMVLCTDVASQQHSTSSAGGGNHRQRQRQPAAAGQPSFPGQLNR